jgi:alcohol dehydrogenase
MPPGYPQFDFQPRTRLVFGSGCAARLGELARELGGSRALVVTDAGIAAAGHLDRAAAALRDAGLEVAVFGDVHENPSDLDVDAAVSAAREARTDLLIGLGGGSSMDAAKGCNFVLTNGGRMADYWGRGKASRPMLPMIAVPTTAGTGSECQSYALIADAATHRKMACGDPKAAPRIALLDPLLTLSQPPGVTACTGIDALAHALEAAVTRTRTPISLLFAREAFRLTIGHLERVLADPDDLEARAAMQLGAAYAGLAIEQSMLGAAHSAANPLTAHYGIVHGQAVGLMLPAVIRFNAAEATAREEYHHLAEVAGIARPTSDPSQAVEALAGRVEALLARADLRPHADRIPTDRLLMLAEEAASQWTAAHNPRTLTSRDFAGLYRAAIAR